MEGGEKDRFINKGIPFKTFPFCERKGGGIPLGEGEKKITVPKWWTSPDRDKTLFRQRVGTPFTGKEKRSPRNLLEGKEKGNLPPLSYKVRDR